MKKDVLKKNKKLLLEKTIALIDWVKTSYGEISIGITIGVLIISVILWVRFSHQILLFLFVDQYNKFNWIGMSAVSAAIGLVSSAIYNIKKYKVDLRSKNRMEWMDKTRPLCAEYGSEFNYYCFQSCQVTMYALNGNNKYDDLLSELNEREVKLDQLYFHLQTLITRDNRSIECGGNQEMLECINEIFNFYKFIGNQADEIQRGLTNHPNVDAEQLVNLVKENDLFKNFSELSALFFKNIWEVVKSGN